MNPKLPLDGRIYTLTVARVLGIIFSVVQEFISVKVTELISECKVWPFGWQDEKNQSILP